MPPFLRQRWFWVTVVLLSILVGGASFILLPFGQPPPPRLPESWEPAPTELKATWAFFDEDPEWLTVSKAAATPQGMLFIERELRGPRGGRNASRLRLVRSDGTSTTSELVGHRLPSVLIVDEHVWVAWEGAAELALVRFHLPSLATVGATMHIPISPQTLNHPHRKLCLARDEGSVFALYGHFGQFAQLDPSLVLDFVLTEFAVATGSEVNREVARIAVTPSLRTSHGGGSIVEVSDAYGVYRWNLQTGEFTLPDEMPSEVILYLPPPAAARPVPPAFNRFDLLRKGAMEFFRSSEDPLVYHASDHGIAKFVNRHAAQPTTPSLWERRGHARFWLRNKLALTPLQPVPIQRWHGGHLVMWPDSPDPAAREPRLLTDDSDVVARWCTQFDWGEEFLWMQPLDSSAVLVMQQLYPSPPSVNGWWGAVRFGRLSRDSDHVEWLYWLAYPQPPEGLQFSDLRVTPTLEGAEWNFSVRWLVFDASDLTQPPTNHSVGAWTTFPNPFLDSPTVEPTN